MIKAFIAFCMLVSQLSAKIEHLWAADLKGNGPTHVACAVTAIREAGLPSEYVTVLIAVARAESHFDPTATSRVEGGKRKTGSWPSSEQAGEGPWFCGVAQTIAETDWNKCLAMRDLLTGYREGAKELKYWLGRSKGDLTNALNAHGCGNIGLTHDCNGYGARVIRLATALKEMPVI